MGKVKVRGFGDLRNIFTERGWAFPLLVSLDNTTTAGKLAKKMDIPVDKIDVTFAGY